MTEIRSMATADCLKVAVDISDAGDFEFYLDIECTSISKLNRLGRSWSGVSVSGTWDASEESACFHVASDSNPSLEVFNLIVSVPTLPPLYAHVILLSSNSVDSWTA